MSDDTQELRDSLSKIRTQLTETEWRTIHNALSIYQIRERRFGQRRVDEIQQLMDKIRDKFIAQKG